MCGTIAWVQRLRQAGWGATLRQRPGPPTLAAFAFGFGGSTSPPRVPRGGR